MKYVEMTIVLLLLVLTVACVSEADGDDLGGGVFKIDDGDYEVPYSYSTTVEFLAYMEYEGEEFTVEKLRFTDTNKAGIKASLSYIVKPTNGIYHVLVDVSFEGTPVMLGSYTFVLEYHGVVKEGNRSHGYTANADFKITVYSTQTLCYDENGGSGGPEDTSSRTSIGYSTFNISSKVPTRPYYTFLGWSESKTATEPTYVAGNKIKVNYDKTVTLYAVWEENVISVSGIPNIVIVSGDECSVVVGCNVSGTTVTLNGASWLTADGNKIGGTSSRAGTYTVEVTVSKDNYRSATATFTVTVAEKLVFMTEPDVEYSLTR